MFQIQFIEADRKSSVIIATFPDDDCEFSESAFSNSSVLLLEEYANRYNLFYFQTRFVSN